MLQAIYLSKHWVRCVVAVQLGVACLEYLRQHGRRRGAVLLLWMCAIECPSSVTTILQVGQALIDSLHRGDGSWTWSFGLGSGYIIGVIVASLSILQRAGTASQCILARMSVATKSSEARSAGVSVLTVAAWALEIRSLGITFVI